MFFQKDDLQYAIIYVYAMSYWLDGEPMEGFFEWLVDQYLDESYKEKYSARGWGYLIDFIPDFSTKDNLKNTDSFLKSVGKFLRYKKRI